MSGKRGFGNFLQLYFRENVLSDRGLPEWLGGALIGVVNVFFLAWALKPFTIFSGYLNWGRYLYEILGLHNLVGKPESFFLFNKTGVGDIGLLLGAFTAAVLSHEFRVRKPLSRGEYIDAILGGLLMSMGTVLAVGCNWGGFFSAITALSLHGFLMFIGLIVGGWLGLLYVNWRTEKLLSIAEVPLALGEADISPKAGARKYSIPLGIIASIAILVVLTLYYVATGAILFLGILFMGFAMGVLIQRSRFCFASAFRDLPRGPEFRRSLALQKGIVVGLFIGVTGAFILKYKGYIDPLIYAKPAGLVNIVGGVIFGLGMVIAGGCASGSLWKAAEGHLRLWVTLLAMVISYPIFRALIHSYMPWIYGPKVFIPYIFGWGPGLAVIYLFLALYFLSLMYLEYKFYGRGGIVG